MSVVWRNAATHIAGLQTEKLCNLLAFQGCFVFFFCLRAQYARCLWLVMSLLLLEGKFIISVLGLCSHNAAISLKHEKIVFLAVSL